MYYSKFDDDSLAEAKINITYHQGILTTRTKKGEWRARYFKLTDKHIQVVNKKGRVDDVEQAVYLKEVEDILYPVTLGPEDGVYDLKSKENYPATFGIQYCDKFDRKSHKIIAYAGNVEECKKWVCYLRNFINKFRQERLEDVDSFNESLELSELKYAPRVVTAKVYINKKMLWEERKVTLDKGSISFHDAKGKLKDIFYLPQVHEFGYPSQVKGSQTPPSYISSVKCLSFRFHSSLRTSSNYTMYIHHAEEAKNWRESLKTLLNGQY